jgi:hypothetical protein
VAAHHRVLHRRQLAARREAFNGDDVRAVHLEDELDARIDRLVLKAAILAAADEHRTRAAIALFTDDFRAGGALIFAEEPRERLERARTADAVRDAVDMDEDVVAHE